MIDWIKDRWKRHQYRKCLAEAFQVTRRVYLNISFESWCYLRQALADLIRDYQIAWGDDEITDFYYQELTYFTKIYNTIGEKK